MGPQNAYRFFFFFSFFDIQKENVGSMHGCVIVSGVYHTVSKNERAEHRNGRLPSGSLAIFTICLFEYENGECVFSTLIWLKFNKVSEGAKKKHLSTRNSAASDTWVAKGKGVKKRSQESEQKWSLNLDDGNIARLPLSPSDKWHKHTFFIQFHANSSRERKAQN